MAGDNNQAPTSAAQRRLGAVVRQLNPTPVHGLLYPASQLNEPASDPKEVTTKQAQKEAAAHYAAAANRH